MARFTWVPDQGASRTHTPNVNKSMFGDGYAQRSANGINSVNEKWALSFTLRSKVEVSDMVAMLKEAKGVSNFDFVGPDGVDLKYTCDSWTDTFYHEGNASLTATFERVYEQ